MLELTEDIIEEMKKRFQSDFEKAYVLLIEYIDKNDILNSYRIIRCIIFLSDHGIESMISSIESALIDPRDVMYWAEYENRESLSQSIRVRDFNKSFQKCSI